MRFAYVTLHTDSEAELVTLHIGGDTEKLTFRIGGDAVNIVRICCVRLTARRADSQIIII